MTREKLSVVAAAIRHPDGTVYSLPPPNRHHNVIWHMVGLGIDTAGHKTIHDQGFVLSDGRYVGRVAAKTVAIAAGQLLDRASKLKELFSECVW